MYLTIKCSNGLNALINVDDISLVQEVEYGDAFYQQSINMAVITLKNAKVVETTHSFREIEQKITETEN